MPIDTGTSDSGTEAGGGMGGGRLTRGEGLRNAQCSGGAEGGEGRNDLRLITCARRSVQCVGRATAQHAL